jgi:hypothetical protein
MSLLYLIVSFLIAGQAGAQSDSPVRKSLASVTGSVYDSIAASPLTGAVVQIVSDDSVGRYGATTTSDGNGRFVFDGVPDGRYNVGFFHAKLDSLGLEPTLRQIRVSGNEPVRIDLAIPSANRLRTAVCGTRSTTDPGGMVMGVVRNAGNGNAVGGATVTGEWLEIFLGRTGLGRRIPQVVAHTTSGGWFYMCNVPRVGMMTLRAGHGNDSTDVVDVQIPPDGLIKAELYLGESRSEVVDTVKQAVDTAKRTVRRIRLGPGRLTGTVLSAEGQRLPDAQVGIVDGPRTRTNERGEWTLVNVPLGTRMLEVRAISYYPRRMPVNVGTDSGSVRVTLSTLRSVLDTVRITASRLGDRHQSGFEERRRSGVGRFLTAADIARRSPQWASEIFQTVAGVRMAGDDIKLRGAFDDCSPGLYIDGQYVPPAPGGLKAADIDMWVNVNQIKGIEVYFDHVPGQFQQGLSGCGSIVIWTK